MNATPPGINPEGNRRRWRDVSAVRVTVALLIGPVLSLALFIVSEYLIIIAFFPGWPWHFDEEDWELCGLMIGYWVLAGWIYLLLVARWREMVSRVACLLQGTVMTLIAPPLLIVPWILVTIPPHAKIDLVIENNLYILHTQPGRIIGYWVASTLLFLPLGLFCGWLLWRVGIRPALSRLADAATVFE